MSTEKNANKHNEHDSAYKSLFKLKEIVISCLLSFLSADILKYLDFNEMQEFSPQTVTNFGKQFHDDMIWKIKWKDTYYYFLFIFEFQSYNDPWMALRLINYEVALLQKLVDTGEIKANEPLPIIMPIVIYNGMRPWTAQKSFERLFGEFPDTFLEFIPKFSYILIDMQRVKKEALDDRELFTLIVKLENAKESSDALSVIKAINVLPVEQRIKDTLTLFIQYIIQKYDRELGEKVKNYNLQELCIMFVDEEFSWHKYTLEKETQKAEAKGEAKGRENTLVEVISNVMKSTGNTLEEAMNIVCVPLSQRPHFAKLVMSL